MFSQVRSEGDRGGGGADPAGGHRDAAGGEGRGRRGEAEDHHRSHTGTRKADSGDTTRELRQTLFYFWVIY